MPTWAWVVILLACLALSFAGMAWAGDPPRGGEE